MCANVQQSNILPMGLFGQIDGRIRTIIKEWRTVGCSVSRRHLNAVKGSVYNEDLAGLNDKAVNIYQLKNVDTTEEFFSFKINGSDRRDILCFIHLLSDRIEH